MLLCIDIIFRNIGIFSCCQIGDVNNINIENNIKNISNKITYKV